MYNKETNASRKKLQLPFLAVRLHVSNYSQGNRKEIRNRWICPTDLVRKTVNRPLLKTMPLSIQTDGTYWIFSIIYVLILDGRGYNTKLINDPKQRKKNTS